MALGLCSRPLLVGGWVDGPPPVGFSPVEGAVIVIHGIWIVLGTILLAV